MALVNNTALIVEDNETLANMLSFLFMSRGIEVKTAMNGEKAMEQIKGLAPDIIITDLMMPKMDGFDLCKAVKRDDKLKHIPMIVVSALSEDKHKEQLSPLKIYNYFQKPFIPAELIACAEKALGKKE